LELRSPLDDHQPVEFGRRDGSDGREYQAKGGENGRGAVVGNVVEDFGRDVFVEGRRGKMDKRKGEVELGDMVEEGRVDVCRRRDGVRLVSEEICVGQ
jgi:hypothetical protein